MRHVRRDIVVEVKTSAVQNMRQDETGRLHFDAPRIIFNGREYTAPQFGDWFRNEILRKGRMPVERTTSKRYRAGTRRTKRLAHGAR